ncbi:MAG: glycosyltransferase family 1 protein, partial [Cytophagales bacterium]|nr:glycosyltransferase family 1 protein [Cytophagales bacterium]
MGTKLAIICSHPIQYYAPLFRYLAQTVNLEVIYCHKPTADEIGKSGFGLSFQWDIDLLEGYPYRFI